MKKFILAGVSLVAWGFASGATAADRIMAPPPNDIIASNNQIIAEFVGTDLDYAEHGGDYGTPTGLLDTEKGWVPGFGLKVSVMGNLWLGNDYLEAEFSRSDGHTRYVGSLIGGLFGSVKGNDGATFTDLDARYGKGYALRTNFMITPYAELGYHKWDREVNQGETYTNFYVGAGALVQWSPVSRLVLSANAMIGTTFSSHIDVAGPFGFSDSLGNSAIYKLGVGVDYAMTTHLHLSTGLDYTDFKYGASPLQSSGFFEPHSTTKITALKVGIGYAF